MPSVDRKVCDTQIELMHAAYGQTCSDLRKDGYYATLARMSDIDFSRTMEFCLSENAPDKLPTAKRLWVIAKELRPARSHGPSAPDLMASRDMIAQAASMRLHDYIQRRVRKRFARYGRSTVSYTSGACEITPHQSMIERVACLVRSKQEWERIVRTNPEYRIVGAGNRLWNELIAEAECEIDEFVDEERKEAAI